MAKPPDTPPAMTGLRDLVQRPQEPESVELRWHILLTDPMCEERVKRHLMRHRFNPYLPVETRVNHYSVRTTFGVQRRERKAQRPIFPGYIFVPLNMAWSFGPLHDTPGLRKNSIFLQVNGEYATLTDAEIDHIQALEYGLANPVIPGMPFKVGSNVRMADGAFIDMVAQVGRIDSAERIELLMDLLGRRVRILATARQIMAV